MTYQFEAVTDEVTSCGLCGKNNLKKTIVLQDEDGTIVFFGSVCAAKALGWGKESSRNVTFEATREIQSVIKKAIELKMEVVWNSENTVKIKNSDKANTLFDFCDDNFNWRNEKEIITVSN